MELWQASVIPPRSCTLHSRAQWGWGGLQGLGLGRGKGLARGVQEPEKDFNLSNCFLQGHGLPCVLR